MRRDQIEQARSMLDQGVPEQFVAGAFGLSRPTLRHCLELADEFEAQVPPRQTAEERDLPAAEEVQGGEGVRASLGSPGPSHGTSSGFSEEEQRAIDEAVKAGKVDRIENGEWPDRNLFNPFPRRR